MFRLSLLGVLVLCAAFVSNAQPHGRGHHDKGASQQLRAELRSWFEQNVAPSVREWQRQYDASLSAEDLATVKRLRTQAAQLRAQRTGNRDGSQREAMQAIAAELKPIMQRSKETLRAIFDANEETIDGWREHVRTTVQEHRSAQGRDGKPHGKGHHGMPMLGDGKRAAVRFVLWDGTMPSLDEATIQRPTSVQKSGSRLADGQASIEVFDMNGVFLRTQSGTIRNGELQERVNLDGLANGQYMASIKASDGSRRSIIVQR